MIKSSEKEIKNDLIFLKISIVLTFLVAGILIDRLFLNKSFNNNPNILGEEKINFKTKNKANTDFLKQTFNNVEKKIEDIGEQALGEVTEFIEDTQEKIASSVSEIIYKTSIEPLIKQIKKLPEDQQEKVKKELCN